MANKLKFTKPIDFNGQVVEGLANTGIASSQDLSSAINTLQLDIDGKAVSLTMDSSTYILSLKDKDNNVLSTVDLPLETMVVGATYDNVNKKIILSLKNGQTVDVPVSDLVNGLATTEYVNNGLSGKVDKVEGKGLSTNDYTNAEKTKLSGIEANAQVNILEGVKDSDGNDLTITEKKVQLPKVYAEEITIW